MADCINILVVGECGDGKSTLIKGLHDPSHSTAPLCGKNPGGVTKEVVLYRCQDLDGKPFNLIDTPGVGDSTVTPAALIAVLEEYLGTGMVPGGIRGVIVTTPVPDSRVKLGAQVVQTVVEKGFVAAEGNNKYANIILTGTKADRADSEEKDNFLHGTDGNKSVRALFFKQAVPPGRGVAVMVHQKDYSWLLEAIRQLPNVSIIYRAPEAKPMARALAGKLGIEEASFEQELSSMREQVGQPGALIRRLVQQMHKAKEQHRQDMKAPEAKLMAKTLAGKLGIEEAAFEQELSSMWEQVGQQSAQIRELMQQMHKANEQHRQDMKQWQKQMVDLQRRMWEDRRRAEEERERRNLEHKKLLKEDQEAARQARQEKIKRWEAKARQQQAAQQQMLEEIQRQAAEERQRHEESQESFRQAMEASRQETRATRECHRLQRSLATMEPWLASLLDQAETDPDYATYRLRVKLRRLVDHVGLHHCCWLHSWEARGDTRLDRCRLPEGHTGTEMWQAGKLPGNLQDFVLMAAAELGIMCRNIVKPEDLGKPFRIYCDLCMRLGIDPAGAKVTPGLSNEESRSGCDTDDDFSDWSIEEIEQDYSQVIQPVHHPVNDPGVPVALNKPFRGTRNAECAPPATVGRDIMVLQLGTRSKVIQEAILQSPPAQRLTQQGLAIRPEKANGAFILTPVDCLEVCSKIWEQRADPDFRLQPSHIVVEGEEDERAVRRAVMEAARQAQCKHMPTFKEVWRDDCSRCDDDDRYAGAVSCSSGDTCSQDFTELARALGKPWVTHELGSICRRTATASCGNSNHHD